MYCQITKCNPKYPKQQIVDSVLFDEIHDNLQDLKREIFRAKCSICCEPTDATLWFQLAVLQFQLAQNLREEIHYRTLKLACDRTLHWIQVQV